MKTRMLLLVAFIFGISFSTIAQTRTVTGTTTDSEEIDIWAGPWEAQEKPDNPTPKQGLDQRLAKRYPDLLHLDRPVSSFKEAALQPSMLTFELLEQAAFVVDVEGTQHCIHNHQCREANPIMGQSRAQQYGVGLPVNFLATFVAIKLRENQHGTLAVALLWPLTIVHATFGIEGFRENPPSLRHIVKWR